MEVDGLNWRSGRKAVWIGLCILLGAALGIGGWLTRAGGENLTKRFIMTHMTNPNGTLATYLQGADSVVPELAAGREALSESLGFWMQAALASDDLAEFERSYEQLVQYFIASEPRYIAWKLSGEGEAQVSTNALGDDLRIIGALLEGARKWEEHPEWIETARQLTNTLLSRSEKNGYLVDFYDFARAEAPDTLSLAYVDLPVLEALMQAGLLDKEAYGRYHALLQDMPDDGVFFPKSYNVVSGEYTYVSEVNMIDQLLVAIYAGETTKAQSLHSFLKREYEQTGMVAGQYRRADRTAAVDYESSSVYGLAIVYSLQQGDPVFANKLYEQMQRLRGQDERYPGGYVFEGNTHIFDNLLPLLGEYAIRRGGHGK